MAEMPVEQEPPCECVCHATEYKDGYAKGFAAGLERAAEIAETKAAQRCIEHNRVRPKIGMSKGACGYSIAAAIRQEGRDGA